MLIHSVYFWLKEDLTEEVQQSFYEGLLALSQIPTAIKVHIGTPAETGDRDIVDNTYTCGIVVIFNDLAGHDTYQNHQIHLDFLSRFSPCWDKILIYDMDIQE
ncbi:MAG TPA: Dabb family protein [Candidatus Hydrogenedens sp.]|nr:Dabb family protein [Candidatus Hydrogenedens sp.]